MSKLKILQLIQTRQNRGAETFTCQLSNHLKELGHEVKIVSIYTGSAELNFSGEIITLGASLKNRFIDYSAWKQLSKIINTFQPDIVQANAGDTLKYAVFSKMFFNWNENVPIVVRNASEMGKYIRSFSQKVLNLLLFKKSNYVISVSKASENDLLTTFSFLQGRTCVIPVGLEENTDIKERKLAPAGKKHLVHVGGFTFEKNHEGLLEIFEAVIESLGNVQLHLIGDGPSRKRIQRRVAEMERTENISFYGYITNPLSYIKAADVLILPSIIEGLPGVLLEAMYCKTPVVAYDVGGVGEIVTPHTGSLVPLHQKEQFANAVIEILSNSSSDKVERAYQMVVKDFMNKRITLDFINAYRKIIGT